MTEFVDRIAESLHGLWVRRRALTGFQEPAWSTAPEDVREDFRGAARTVLVVIREPTWDMAGRGVAAYAEEASDVPQIRIAAAWREMIADALGEPIGV